MNPSRVQQDLPCKPNLGCATTRELLTEIQARGEVSATIGEYPQEMGDMAMGAANLLRSLPGSMLDYRHHWEWGPCNCGYGYDHA